MGAVFGKNNAKLSVISKYKRIDGSDFSDSTKENIEDGQKFMSMGLMAGVRKSIST
ncbi:hypothetical protein JCM6292_3100 [Bacteroides pyogenes JCM 6292]|uniref:Uncharacterized protein n=2 Tax=Bacteroides pyogenes TaxID=310300 RepID=W4PBV2_9BACE|nr:hypothetical protein JCM6292_3100 [Bacteroides pyogenes JCM 6292]